MKIKYNRFALFPHTCSRCEKLFWLEPYKRFKMDEYKVFGCITYVTTICKECNNKIENEEEGELDKEYIHIPEKATNGDMIKAVFPNALRSDYIENDMTIIYLQDENESEMVVPEDWWNAKYKAGDTDGNS